MKLLRTAAFSLVALSIVSSGAFGMKHLPEERGKTLFEDPKAFGGKKACSECHPGGKGLENAAARKEFKIMGGKQKTIEEAVNACITKANMGKAIDPKSDQMKDMVAHIKSLKPKKTEKKSAGY